MSDNINFIEEKDCSHHNLNLPTFKEVYHGVMSREVAIKVLKADGRNNVFLMRKRNNPESGDFEEFILSFLSNGVDYHFIIKRSDNSFILAGRYFPYFKCLLSHYMNSCIINDVCLNNGVSCQSFSAIKEALQGKSCYLSESLSQEDITKLFKDNGPGSYLFRTRTDNLNEYVILFFDGKQIRKIRMELRLVKVQENFSDNSDERYISNNGDENNARTVVVLALGENMFESWEEMVENFTANPIVPLTSDGAVQDKLVTPIKVNNSEQTETDVYRQIKFSSPANQTAAFSVHGDVQIYDSYKKKFRDYYGYVDKDLSHLMLCGSSNKPYKLNECNFIPIDYSVYQRYSFLLELKDRHSIIIAMVDPKPASVSERKDYPEETYAYRTYPIDGEKEVYNCTEYDNETNAMMCRAYDRWVVAVKRHCANTKDDISNEETEARHLKLHRYNRKIRIVIEHNSGSELFLTDTDLVNVNPNPVLSSSYNSSFLSQFEVMYKSHLIAVIPRKLEKVQQHPQVLSFNDLPSDVNDISVYFRLKTNKKKEYLKKMCEYTKMHQKLVPPSNTFDRASPNIVHQIQNSDNDIELRTNSMNISNDSSSNFEPSVHPIECNAVIQYTESIILPIKNYYPLSNYIMSNVEKIFRNNFLLESLMNATQQDEYKKIFDCFLHMASWEKKPVEFIFSMIEQEIDRNETDPKMFFRHNSSWNRVFVNYIRMFSMDWMVKSLMGLFKKIYLQTDILKATPHSCSPHNSQNLTFDSQSGEDTCCSGITCQPQVFESCLVALLDGIVENVHHCPLPIRHIYQKIQSKLKSIYPNAFEQQYDPSLQSSLSTNQVMIQYIIITNIFILRFINATLIPPGDRFNELFKCISEQISKSDDNELKNFPTVKDLKTIQTDSLVGYMKAISKRVLQCFSVSIIQECQPLDKSFIESCRIKYLLQLNEKMMETVNKSKMMEEINEERKKVCLKSSLSRRFNDVLEFLNQLKSEPSFFINNNYQKSLYSTNINQNYGADQLNNEQVEQYHKLFNTELNSIIEQINKTKKGTNVNN